MKKENLKQILTYLALFVIIALGVFLFYLFIGFPDRQFLVILVTASAYFLWGIVHHLLEGDFHPKIVVEYLLIAILAVVLLRGAIYR